MKRNRKFLIALLCSFALLGDSAAIFAQNKDKKQEPTAKKQVFISREGHTVEVPGGGGVWVEETGHGNQTHFSFADSGAGFVTSHDGSPQVQIVHNDFHFDSNIVKGAPYAADAVTEFVQILGDGNRITRTSSAKIYRDSVGRTRREQALKSVGSWSVAGDNPVTISINDPVAGTHYTLNPSTRTATKVAVHRITATVSDKGEKGDKVATYTFSSSSTKSNVKGEGNSEHFKFVTDDNRTIVLSGDGAEKAIAEVKARKAAPAGVVSGVSVAGDKVMAFSSEAEVNKETLGTQMIEGVMAEGTRVTFTIPAGKIGNAMPIVTVNERWYSPELQTVVMSKNSDPRSGETTYRLTNINRSEPDASLFQVPGDYTIKENSFNFTGKSSEDIIKMKLEAAKKHEAEMKSRKPNEK